MKPGHLRKCYLNKEAYEIPEYEIPKTIEYLDPEGEESEEESDQEKLDRVGNDIDERSSLDDSKCSASNSGESSSESEHKVDSSVSIEKPTMRDA